MVEYKARWDEIREKILILGERQRSGRDEVESISVLQKYTKFIDSMKGYMDWRDKALNNALLILTIESTSITGAAQKDKWDDYFEKVGQEAHQMILGFVPDDDTNTPLRLLCEGFATLESIFFTKLKSVPLAWFQGQVQVYTYEFYTEMNSLETKWKNLLSSDQYADSKVKNTSAQVLQIFKDKVAGLVMQQRAGEEGLRRGVSIAKLDASVPMEMKAALTAVQLMLTKAKELQKSIDDLVTIFMNAYKSEETVVILFDQTRNGVNEFLNKTNFDTSVEEFETTYENSLNMAKQCKTKGQQEDALKFVQKATPLVKNMFDEFKTQYEEFISENRGIFVGPVGDSQIEEILEKRDMDYAWRDIRAFNIQQKLKDIHNDTVRAWHVDINGLTDKQKKEIEDFWHGELERLGRGLLLVAEGTTWDRLKQVFTIKRKQLESMVKSSKGGLQ